MKDYWMLKGPERENSYVFLLPLFIFHITQLHWENLVVCERFTDNCKKIQSDYDLKGKSCLLPWFIYR